MNDENKNIETVSHAIQLIKENQKKETIFYKISYKWHMFTGYVGDKVYDIHPTTYFLFCRVKHFWYEQVSTRIRPRNKWVNKYVPRTWMDKTELIPQLLYGSIIHYIEGEKCFEVIEYSSKPEIKQMLDEIYNWAKTGRDNHLEKIVGAHPPIEEAGFDRVPTGDLDDHGRPYYRLEQKSKKSYEELYGEVNRLEDEFKNIDDKYLTWIVLNRETLWT
jgi:hypothetical protein